MSRPREGAGRSGCGHAVVVVAALLWSGSACEAAPPPEGGQSSGSPDPRSELLQDPQSDDTEASVSADGRTLDPNRPALMQPVGEALRDGGRARVLEVELVEVRNPERHPLEIEVLHQADDGSQRRLGSFGPFPADQTGTFGVPTSGRLEGGGDIVVRLVVPVSWQEGQTLEVEIGQVRLRPER